MLELNPMYIWDVLDALFQSEHGVLNTIRGFVRFDNEI